MKVLHLLASGGAGGIEVLNRDFSEHSHHENVFLFLWSGGCIADEMKSKKKKVVELNASKKAVLFSLKKVLQICKEEQIDVIIVHHAAPLMHIYGMVVKKMYPETKVITYAHGRAEVMCRTQDKKGLWVRKWVMKTSLQFADDIVGISQNVKDSLIEYFGIDKDKIKIIYNGVDTSRFKINTRQENKVAEIIYVGRLIEQKGVQNILCALSMVSDKIQYRFRVIGDGAYRERLEQLTEELGLGEKVEFLGTRNDVPDFLKESDVFVHIPDLEEGFGITVIEAMAAGVIPVCAYSGGIPEIIQNDVNGILLERDDRAKLANTLEDLMVNLSGEKVQNMRNAAVKRAEQFSIETFVKQLDLLIAKR